MSARLAISTLRFTTVNVESLEYTLSLLGYSYEKREGVITVCNRQIIIGESSFYMQLYSDDMEGVRLFRVINSRLAEVEALIREKELSRLERERERAAEAEEAYRVRRIKTEEERLEYERGRLELERKSFAEAKKRAIIDKARSMGYSVEEREENGSIKLKLVKRIY